MKQCPQLSLERVPQTSMKRCKLFHVFRDKDRMTNLEENLLSQILSRLPTKDVVRTCILSKGWRYKWTTSYNMIVNDDEEIWSYPSFANFMTRILEYSMPQRSIHLSFRSFYTPISIQTWFSSALEHRLEVLEVYSTTPGIVIPCSLLNSTCLKELKLIFCNSSLDVAAMNCAPNLTSLYITGVDIMNKHHYISTTVKFKVPLLETFTLSDFKWYNVKSVELHAPSLTTFTYEPTKLKPEHAEYAYSVVIIAPRLSNFHCGIFVPEKFILDGSSVVAARFDCFGVFLYDLEFLTNTGIRVRKLLNEFKNLEELHLSSFLVKGSELGPPLQRHDKLRHLTLTSQINPELLLQLLHAAPSLKILSLTMPGWVDYHYAATEEVPSCILSQLEEVEFNGFSWETPQYHLLKFLCKNGHRLKTLTMSGLSWERQNKVKKFVSAIRNVEFVF